MEWPAHLPLEGGGGVSRLFIVKAPPRGLPAGGLHSLTGL